MARSLSFYLKLFTSFAFSSVAQAQVTLQFSTFSSALTNISGADWVVGENGLVWGIVIDTGGDGFSPFFVDLDKACFLSDGLEVAPGEFFFMGGVTTEVPASFLESGSGGVTTSVAIPAYSEPLVAEGQEFAIVWFEAGVTSGSLLKAGSRYGLFTNPLLLLPPNSSSNASFTSLFVGDDPVRSANLSFQARLPLIECGIEASRLFVDFEVDMRTAENVTFDLESLVIGSGSSWALEGLTPEVVETNGNLSLLRLTFPETVLERREVLTRVKLVP